MDEIRIELQILHPELGKTIPLPERMSEHAAGFDICAAVNESVTLQPGTRVLIPSGFAIALPVGFEAQIRPRSGLALKHGITVLNSPGTVDADYRGEVKVLLINLGQDPFVVTPGLRIAQMVIATVEAPRLAVVTTLLATKRGSGGYGSTGS